MSAEESTFERIEEYLLGMMTHSEEEAFKSELAANPSLQSQLELHRLASNLLIEKQLLSVKSTLKEIDTSSKTWTAKKIIGRATGLILLLAGTYFAFQLLPTKTPEAVSSAFKNESKQPISAPQNSVKEESSKEPTHLSPIVSVSPSTASIPMESEVKRNNPIPLEEAPILDKPSETEKNTARESLEKEAVSNTPKLTPQSPSIPIDPCKLVQLTAHISTQATCSNKQEGIISISQVKGGEIPYKTSILNEEHQVMNLSTSLSAGTYTVMIADARGCVQKFEKISVRTKPCNHDASFNPFMGESWEIPVSSQNGTLRIHDVNGALYFEKEVRAHDKESWSGQSLHGEQKSGYFPFEIQYQDGSSIRGTITLSK
jgi:hypothetical protein